MLVSLAVALAALAASAPTPADAAPKADLALIKLSRVPAAAPTGPGLMLRAQIKNVGRKRAKRAKLIIDLVAPGGGALAERVKAGAVPRLRPRARRAVVVKPRIPFEAVGTWIVRVCVAPARQANDCRDTKPIRFRDGSALGRIDAARAAGTLSAGKALLFKLYAASEDERLPKPYDRGGPVPTGVVVSELAQAYPTLPEADQALVAPYMLQPRYAESAWSPSQAQLTARAPAARRRADPCADLTQVSGAWSGVETEHAWFWHRPNSAAGRSKAQALAAAFEADVWPKLTGPFREVSDAGAAPCDPAGDAKVDVYIASGNGLLAGGREGVTPGLSLDSSCGPKPSFIVLPVTAKRSTLAHEFTHAIQWVYAACQRYPAWVEGTATWGADFVYPGAQDEHNYKTALQSPFLALRDPALSYASWPFWYSLSRSDGANGIVRVFEALESGNLSAALEEGPADGLYETWKRFAVQRWNGPPIGAAGFSVGESFAEWDGFTAKPLGVSPVKVRLQGRPTTAVPLPTFEQRPLSTSFHQVQITDKAVRHLEFENDDDGLPDANVQAFLKLADGTWRLEDWSDQGEVEFCRDKPDENVVEMVVATSNAAPDGNPLGVANHVLRAKDVCDQPTYQGTFSGTTRQFDPSPLATYEFVTEFRGTMTLVPYEGPGATGREWRLADGTLHIDRFSGGIAPCELTATPKTFTLPGTGQGIQPVMALVQGGYTLSLPWVTYFPSQSVTVAWSGDAEQCDREPTEWPLDGVGQRMTYTPAPIQPDENGHLRVTNVAFGSPGFEHSNFEYTLIPVVAP